MTRRSSPENRDVLRGVQAAHAAAMRRNTAIHVTGYHVTIGPVREPVKGELHRPGGSFASSLIVPALCVAAVCVTSGMFAANLSPDDPRFVSHFFPDYPMVRLQLDVLRGAPSVPALTQRVELRSALFVGETEITRGQWWSLMHSRADPGPSGVCPADLPEATGDAWRGQPPTSPESPATCVGWCDALRFANKLSEKDLLRPAYRGLQWCERRPERVAWDFAADGYRLPTVGEIESLVDLADMPKQPSKLRLWSWGGLPRSWPDARSLPSQTTFDVSALQTNDFVYNHRAVAIETGGVATSGVEGSSSGRSDVGFRLVRRAADGIVYRVAPTVQ